MKRPNAGLRVLGDLMTTMFFAFAVIVVMLIPLIHEVTQQKETVEQPPTQGNLTVELYWNDDVNVDVDLWLRASADGIPVGYSNKGGVVFNLLRDDVGTQVDLSGRNMEIAYSRGLPDGEYIINAHLFSVRDSSNVPLPIKLLVSYRRDDNGVNQQLFLIDSVLKHYGEEKTLARFNVKNGEFVASSLNSLFEPIRDVRSSPQ